MRDILYLSFDSLREGVGASQVLAYMRKVAPHFSVTIVSFEKQPPNLKDKSNVEKDVQAHIVDQQPPHLEEGVDEDGEENPFSSHENEDEDEGASREDRQGDKKRKRDAKYEEKHSEE